MSSSASAKGSKVLRFSIDINSSFDGNLEGVFVLLKEKVLRSPSRVYR